MIKEIDTTDILPVLKEMDDSAKVIVVEAPPGAGKTFLVAVSVAHAVQRKTPPLVVANSYEQIFGAVRRVTQLFPKIKPMIFASKDRKNKEYAKANAYGFDWGITWREVATAIEQGRPIFTVVSKARVSRLSDEGQQEHVFPWMIIDEAFQVTDAEFALLSPLADRFLMVGDRGQIQPIVTTDPAQWRNDPLGPHLSAPEAIVLRKHLTSEIVKSPMTISRRLSQQTVDILQPIFYPTLPFIGNKEIREILKPIDLDNSPEARIFAEGCGQQKKGFIPVLVSGIGRKNSTDLGALRAMSDLAKFICTTAPVIKTDTTERPTTPEDIVLLVTRNNERRWLQQQLTEWPGITIATANKFQGSEKPISLVLHPLSGKTRATDFDLESGRLCVVLSRHTHLSFVFHRDGIKSLVERRIPNTARALGSAIDRAFEGWWAHRQFIHWMEDKNNQVIYQKNEENTKNFDSIQVNVV